MVDPFAPYPVPDEPFELDLAVYGGVGLPVFEMTGELPNGLQWTGRGLNVDP